MLPMPENFPWLWERTQYLTKHGSNAYGMARPQSDLDIRGFCIPPKEYFYGFRHKFEQYQFQALDLDIVVFDIRKFFTLASACNPNAIEILFTDSTDHFPGTTEAGNLVLKNRDLFLSQRARNTFSGYAISQLRRLHNQFNKDGTYNAKDAMHLVRLMRMCVEIGQTGQVNVKRADKEELMAIREGSWAFVDVIKYAESIDASLDKVYKGSSLPIEPNYSVLEDLLVDVVQSNV